MHYSINFIIILILCCFFICDAADTADNNLMDYQNIGRQLVEEGRTLVHHAVKRFMIILPAIFFKLGIAFTLLVLVTIVAINNGFIGFLLLVVGLSSVLARLQDSKRPIGHSVPYVSYSLPSYHHHHSAWDRSDSQIQQQSGDANKLAYAGYVAQSQYNNNPAVGYYAKYAPSKV